MPLGKLSLLGFALSCLLLLCCARVLGAELKPYVAEYESVIGGFNIDLQRKLEKKGALYVLSMNMKKLFVSIEERGEFEVVDDNIIKALSYQHLRSGISKRHNTDLQFDWQKKQVVDLLHKKRDPLPLEFPSYDKLSYQEQFRLQLNNAPMALNYEFQLVSGKRVKRYLYQFVAQETIATPLGQLKTLKFQRESKSSGRTTTIWFAKDLDHLIARIDFTDKPGDKPDRLLIKSASIDGGETIVKR